MPKARRQKAKANKKDTRKRLRAITWFLTYPKCTLEREEVAQALTKVGKYKELIVAKETHQDGEPHLHVYVKFEEEKDCTSGKTFDIGEFHGNYQACRSWKAVMEYIVKEDKEYLAVGIDPKSSLRKRAARNKELLEEDPRMLVQSGSLSATMLTTVLKARAAFGLLEPAEDRTEARGIWIYGPPGTGKSYAARHNYGPFFVKAQSKWWDGYAGQKTVILDDLDSDTLGHYLKIWMDEYACQGEIKGATIALNYDKFIVTSNYHPDELWPNNQVMARAILDRCELIHMDGPSRRSRGKSPEVSFAMTQEQLIDDLFDLS